MFKGWDETDGGTYHHIVLLLPFNILTATVLQVAVLSIPKASASITCPKAPRPRGLPRVNNKTDVDFITTETIGRDSDLMGWPYILVSWTVLLTPSSWLSNLIPRSSLVALMVKNLPAMWETWVRSLGWEVPLEKRMDTHSSILAWRIPWTELPSRLQSMWGAKSQTQLRDFHFTGLLPVPHYLHSPNVLLWAIIQGAYFSVTKWMITRIQEMKWIF